MEEVIVVLAPPLVDLLCKLENACIVIHQDERLCCWILEAPSIIRKVEVLALIVVICRLCIKLGVS